MNLKSVPLLERGGIFLYINMEEMHSRGEMVNAVTAEHHHRTNKVEQQRWCGLCVSFFKHKFVNNSLILVCPCISRTGASLEGIIEILGKNTVCILRSFY